MSDELFRLPGDPELVPQYSMGWRPSLPDIRDNLYAFRAAPSIIAMLPAAFNLANPSPGPLFTKTWDQGNIGSCGPHTLAENLLYDMLTDMAPGNEPVSRLFLYWVTRYMMGTVNSDSGVDNRTMLKAVAKYGFPKESSWPYDTSKYKVQPPQSVFAEAAQNKAGILYQSVPQSLDQMKGCIFTVKKPFVGGFSVYSSMMSNQVAQTGDVPMPSASDQQVGGHDVLIVGWDDTTQRLIFKNHWMRGANVPWGNQGYGTIPYAYFTNPQLAGDFWTVTQAVAQPDVPPPQPIPVPPIPVPIPPQPIPVPPQPIPIPPIDPATLKNKIDMIFAFLESLPFMPDTVVTILREIQAVIDSALTPSQKMMIGAVPPTVIDIINMAFEAAKAKFPQYAWFIAAAQSMVINWLKRQA